MYSPLIALLKKKNLLPVIIFTFSKKKCEDYAGALSNVDLTSGSSEKSVIHVFIEKSLGCLKGDSLVACLFRKEVIVNCLRSKGCETFYLVESQSIMEDFCQS